MQAPLANTKAVSIGDLIHACDFKPVAKKKTKDVMKMLKGEPYSTVTLTVQRCTLLERLDEGPQTPNGVQAPLSPQHESASPTWPSSPDSRRSHEAIDTITVSPRALSVSDRMFAEKLKLLNLHNRGRIFSDATENSASSDVRLGHGRCSRGGGEGLPFPRSHDRQTLPRSRSAELLDAPHADDAS